MPAWLLLLILSGTASAVPHVNRSTHTIAIAARQTDAPATPADPTAPWVTVDESGRPKTVTPVLTTISGTPTIISGAPYELTGTVFTQTRFDAIITTSTGVAAAPTANKGDGSGAFALCHNTEGDFAPFCEPKNNASIYPDNTRYSMSSTPILPIIPQVLTTTVQLPGIPYSLSPPTPLSASSAFTTRPKKPSPQNS